MRAQNFRHEKSSEWRCRTMVSDWLLRETSTHQDHVIAHLIGATVLGYLVVDEATHILLDIGFIWTIYLDGEMGFVPQSVAVSELGIDPDVKAELLTDIQLLHNQGHDARELARFSPAPAGCLITEVEFYAHDDQRRILVKGEEVGLAVDASLATGEIRVEIISPEGYAV